MLHGFYNNEMGFSDCLPADSVSATPRSDIPLAGSPDAGARATAACRASAWRFVVPSFLVLLVLLAFMPALDAGFVYWDDDDLILNNTRYRTLDAQSLRWMFTTFYAGHFQPLTWLSYTLDWALWKREPFGYHLTNVVLHALTAVAFYFVSRRLLSFTTGAGSTRSTPVVLSAALAASLFAVHPLRAESVAWIAERRDVLSGFLYVLAVGSYLRYTLRIRSRPLFEPGHPGWLFYVSSVLLCGASLLAKASAITLPVVLLILDVYPLRRWTIWPADPAKPGISPALTESLCGSASSEVLGSPLQNQRHNRVWLEKVPFFILAVAAGVGALIAQKKTGVLYSYAEHDLWARFAQTCYGLTFYLWKTLWPTNLGPLYEIPPREVLFLDLLWGSLIAVPAVGFAAVRLRRRWPALMAALAVYVVVLFPVLGIAQSGPQLVADRYSYLSCLGFAVLAGAVLLR